MDDQIINHISKEFNKETILDGIVHHESYNNAEKKILWILKEPNSANDLSSWDMRGAILNDLKSASGIENRFQSTFTKIVYVTNGILKNKYWEELLDITDDPNMIDELKKIAYINVKKTAGFALAKPAEIKDYYIRSKEILLEQINTINPDILIFGKTFNLFKDDLFVPELNNYGTCKAISYNNKIYIDAYHPACRSKQNIYCNDIINAIQKEQNA
jgi:hypothetical protein